MVSKHCYPQKKVSKLKNFTVLVSKQVAMKHSSVQQYNV